MPARDDPALVAVENALTAILRQANLHRLHESVAAGAGLTLDRAAYPVLGRIDQEGGRARLSDVAGALGVALPTMSRQVKHLEADGLVRRAVDPADGRASLLELTPAGRKTLQAYRNAWRRLLAQILDPWSVEDRALLAALLERLGQGLVSPAR
jgi:DNA-binding MarR family transcriptional regulator